MIFTEAVENLDFLFCSKALMNTSSNCFKESGSTSWEKEGIMNNIREKNKIVFFIETGK